MKQPEFQITNINGKITLEFFYRNGPSRMKVLHPASTEKGIALVRQIVEQSAEGTYECIRLSKNVHAFKLVDADGHMICESEGFTSYRNCEEGQTNFKSAVANAKLFTETNTRNEVKL
jgi:uncharacterized protein YegP (UPF0339 family)